MTLKALEKLVRFVAHRVAERVAAVIIERIDNMDAKLSQSISDLQASVNGAIQRQNVRIQNQVQTIADLQQQLRAANDAISTSDAEVSAALAQVAAGADAILPLAATEVKPPAAAV